MIVIVIISVIVTLTTVYYNGVQIKARDISTLSDIDQMDVLQTNYGLNNGAVGKAYYSGNGPDSELGFTPAEGTVIDVVIDDNDYCIRAYNADGTKDSILNAYFKETTAGICTTLAASSAALSTVAPGLVPNITIEHVGDNLVAEVDAVACQGGITQYQVNSRINDGEWAGYGEWSTDRIVIQTISDSVKYEYQAQAKCYTSDTIQSSPVLGAASNYTYNDDHMPIATSVSGYWSDAPDGYLLEDGSAVSRDKYSNLFAVVGTTYGSGDGSTTFNLPDSRGRVAVNKNSPDAEFASMGQKYGEKTHLVTGAESGLKGHNHGQNAHGHSKVMNFANSFPGGSDRPLYYGTNSASLATVWTDNTTATNNAVSSANASTAHNNIQPSIVKNFAIKYTPASAAVDYVAKGTSITGYFANEPAGYMFEDGSEISRSTYSDLFDVIGTTYGAGDGSTTFNIPDSRGRMTVDMSLADVEFDTIGEKFGSKTHLFTSSQSGEKGHNHTQNAHSHSKVHNFASSFPGGTDRPLYYGTNSASLATVWTDNATATNIAVSASDSTSSHYNLQPYIVQNSAIKY